MAVEWIREHWPNRSGAFYPADDSMMHRYWKIKVTSKTDTSHNIATTGTASGQLPLYLASHPQNLFYTCRRLVIRPERKTWKFWTAQADYSTRPLDTEDRERSEQPNPLLRPTKITMSGSQYEEYTTVDRDGTPMANSAEDVYPGQVKQVPRVRVTFRKNVSQRPTWAFNLIASVNKSAYQVQDVTIPAEKGLMASVEIGELQEEGNYQYYTLTASVDVKRDDWQLHLADEGFHYLDGSTKRKITVQDEDGNEEGARTAQFLDGSGGVLAVGGTPVVNDFDVQEALEWGDLPF